MNNPIRSVDGNKIPCPSTYQYTLQDVSGSDAGRLESGEMQKNRIGQVVGINLQWASLKTKEVSQILKAFDPEYIMVDYLDAKHGGYLKKKFYVGDRAAPLYNAELARWESLSLSIIMSDGGQII